MKNENEIIKVTKLDTDAKEILFEGIEEFVSFGEQQGYIVSDITDVCTPGANPDFFMDLLK